MPLLQHWITNLHSKKSDKKYRSNHQRCSIKKMLLKISQNSQEKRLWRRWFPVNFENFLRAPFLQNTSGRQLLKKKKIFWDYQDIALKMKFSVKDFFSRCNQICSFLRLWSRLLKKSLIENSIFYAVGISGINLFSQISQPTSKVNIGKTRTTSETRSKLIKKPEKCHWHHWSIYFTTQKVKFFNFSFLHSAFSRDLFSHFWGKKSFELKFVS